MSPDPQVRIKAIETLDNQVSEQKSVLHELAFNDADSKVSLAALYKLDSFVLWYKMSEIAKDELVKRKSVKLVESVLLSESDTTLTSSERRKFILELKDNSLLEKLLAQAWVQKDAELSMRILRKIDKPLFRDKILVTTSNEALQLTILDSLKDAPSNRKLLNKFIKRSPSVAAQNKAEELLSLWFKVEKIPVELEQQMKMLLSRLLTLKDHQDLEYIEKLRTDLDFEYHKLSESFNYLDEVRRTEIQQKYLDISSKVNRNIELLKPVWIAQQVKLVRDNSIDTVSQNIEDYLGEVHTQLDSRIAELTTEEVDGFKFKLMQFGKELIQLIGDVPVSEIKQHQCLEQLNNKVNQSVHTLANFSGLQEAVLAAQHLVEKLEAQPLPSGPNDLDGAQAFLDDLNKNWRSVIGQCANFLPQELYERWNKQTKVWKKAVSEHRKELNAELNRCRNKLKAVDSLVHQGKFKAAMGLYQKVHVWFDNLNEKQQAQLQKAFSNVQQQIENLKDWQDYISAPRKPALLDEAESLIAKPLPIEAQSKAIKVLRSQWNSLGKTGTESDQVLNNAFDVAIEAAFAPCREHYEQQQKLRASNLQFKTQLLEAIQLLSNADIPIMELAKQLRLLQQKWRSSGGVDFKLRNELNEEFQALVEPLKQKINKFYNDNALQKQRLLDQARLLIELEPISEAIEEAKSLQQRWKSIEHAGRKAEADLWQAFRQANDNLFAKRAELNQQHKLEVKQQIEEIKLKVNTLKLNLNKAKNKSELKQALQDTPAVQDLLKSIPNNTRKELEHEINCVFEQQKRQLSELSKNEKSKEYIQLFETLRHWEQGANRPDVTDLRKHWQSGFTKAPALTNRDEITLKMEVIADKPSPLSEQNKRKQVQMELMAHKLQSGNSLELNTLLLDWIKGGELSETDKPLLERVERVFVS
ncbi:DUF349 domain-containing protein [Paraglaciecola sp.]|uniref:DUF349 domain-containing protein n=2 Tax=Paraglaciecola sp. TaxID=1920173 RepID=UPI003299C063